MTMRHLDVRCEVCGAGWKLAQPNALAKRLVEEALARHEEGHRWIAVTHHHAQEPEVELGPYAI